MDQYWVGLGGDITSEQLAILQDAGFPLDNGLRQTSAAYGRPPLKWATERTFVPVSAEDMSAATALVAKTLTLDPGDLVAYPADAFVTFDQRD